MDDRLIFKIVVTARLPFEGARDPGNFVDHTILVRTNKGILAAMSKAAEWLGDGWLEKTVKSASIVGDVLIDLGDDDK